MQNIFQRITKNFKKADKRRTITLAIFLSLLIVLPLMVNTPQKKPIEKQYAQTAPQGLLPIYGTYGNSLDTFSPGWSSKITNGGATSTHNITDKTHSYCGTGSLSWTAASSSDRLDILASAPFDISPYTYLTVFAEATAPNQNIEVLLIGTDGNPLPAPATTYPLIQMTVGSWTIYDVPISSFNTTNKTILGIAFKYQNGSTPTAPVYFDEINFSTQIGTATPCGVAPTAIINATPTPDLIDDPYSPQINPWIFIIPAILIGLAIIFQ